MHKSLIIDLDESLVDFVNPFLASVNEDFGTQVRREQIRRYKFRENPEFPVKTQEEERAAVEKFGNQGGYLHLAPFPNTKTVIERLRSSYFLDIVTHRPSTSQIVQDTHTSIQTHYHNLFRKIFFSKGSKAEYAHFNTLAVIDDSPLVATEFAQRQIDVILMNAPWNTLQEYPDLNHSRVHRTFSWLEVPSRLREINQKSLCP